MAESILPTQRAENDSKTGSSLRSGLPALARGPGKREIESGTLPHFALDPDASSVYLDDSFHQRQAHSSPLALGVQLVEQSKDALVKLRGDADAVIAHEEDGFAGFLSVEADFDARLRLITHEFGGVVHQILHDLYQALMIAVHGRQIVLNVQLYF